MVFGTKTPRRRVALFGGSFNPPHIGHSAICRWVFHRGLADEVWAIPCFDHPFGKRLAPFDHRLAMCRLAFMKLRLPIRVLDVERRLGGVSFSVRTIEHLRSLHPGVRFSLVTGGDVQGQAPAWRGFERIRGQVDLIPIPRGEGSPIPDVSSTEVRRRIEAGEPYRDLIEPEIAIYIVTKGLYR